MADMEALRAELAASKAREAALEQRLESLEHASPINFINTLFAKQESPEATSAQRTIATTRDVHDAAEQLKTVDAAAHEEVVKRQSELDQLRAELHRGVDRHCDATSKYIDAAEKRMLRKTKLASARTSALLAQAAEVQRVCAVSLQHQDFAEFTGRHADLVLRAEAHENRDRGVPALRDEVRKLKRGLGLVLSPPLARASELADLALRKLIRISVSGYLSSPLAELFTRDLGTTVRLIFSFSGPSEEDEEERIVWASTVASFDCLLRDRLVMVRPIRSAAWVAKVSKEEGEESDDDDSDADTTSESLVSIISTYRRSCAGGGTTATKTSSSGWSQGVLAPAVALAKLESKQRDNELEARRASSSNGDGAEENEAEEEVLLVRTEEIVPMTTPELVAREWCLSNLEDEEIAAHLYAAHESAAIIDAEAHHDEDTTVCCCQCTEEFDTRRELSAHYRNTRACGERRSKHMDASQCIVKGCFWKATAAGLGEGKFGTLHVETHHHPNYTIEEDGRLIKYSGTGSFFPAMSEEVFEPSSGVHTWGLEIVADPTGQMNFMCGVCREAELFGGQNVYGRAASFYLNVGGGQTMHGNGLGQQSGMNSGAIGARVGSIVNFELDMDAGTLKISVDQGAQHVSHYTGLSGQRVRAYVEMMETNAQVRLVPSSAAGVTKKKKKKKKTKKKKKAGEKKRAARSRVHRVTLGCTMCGDGSSHTVCGACRVENGMDGNW